LAIQKFDLPSLRDLDNGRVSEAFLHAMRRCEYDCKDRPATPDARKVTLTCELVPVCTPAGELESVDVTFQIKDSVPVRRSARYNMKAVEGGGLLFNDLSPDDIRQATIDEPRGPRSAAQ